MPERKGEEIDLTEEDDKILDKIWDDVGKENDESSTGRTDTGRD